MVKLRPRFLEFDFESRNRSPSGKSLVRKYPAFFDHAIFREMNVLWICIHKAYLSWTQHPLIRVRRPPYSAYH